MTSVDVLVVGGGQAGLAAAYHLRAQGIDYLVVDSGERIGDSWRERYASLTLFTPRQFSGLPGFLVPGNRDGYPSRDEFADYLEAYAASFRLNVRSSTVIAKLLKRDDGAFEARTADGETLVARRVIIATGGFQSAVIPQLAADFAPVVRQLTAENYRDPSQVTDGPVLVVGDGASGRDIAVELAAKHKTYLATGKPRRLFPERILGKTVWWWLNWTGLLRAGPESRIGRKIRAADAFPDRDRSEESLGRLGVILLPRLVAAAGNVARFQNGGSAAIRTIIWAIGYRDATDWVAIPGVVDAAGAFIHDAGVSPIARLYFVGRPWQRNRASALVMGAGPDAGHIVERLAQPPAGSVRRRPPAAG